MYDAPYIASGSTIAGVSNLRRRHKLQKQDAFFFPSGRCFALPTIASLLGILLSGLDLPLPRCQMTPVPATIDAAPSPDSILPSVRQTPGSQSGKPSSSLGSSLRDLRASPRRPQDSGFVWVPSITLLPGSNTGWGVRNVADGLDDPCYGVLSYPPTLSNGGLSV